MEAVIKVGGSLAEHPADLRKLCHKLGTIAQTRRVLVVPGGGKFADTVREFDKIYDLSNTISHKMAILAMDQFGLFLSHITPNSHVSYSIKEMEKSVTGMLPILLPSRFVFCKDPLEHSWDVTSDTIAAHIASVLHARKLILVTDVDGIFTKDPKKDSNATLIKGMSAKKLLAWNNTTSVDKTLPKILLRTKLDCFIVNGRYPKRIEAILENEKPISTHITF
ncbi:MAG: delta 1-pyrroline-5-carboxylate synthetase [Candidatus Bathyarchaeia archaeon]